VDNTGLVGHMEKSIPELPISTESFACVCSLRCSRSAYSAFPVTAPFIVSPVSRLRSTTWYLSVQWLPLCMFWYRHYGDCTTLDACGCSHALVDGLQRVPVLRILASCSYR